MDQEYEVNWTDGAIAELKEITAYIAQDNPDAAERITAAIVDAVQRLRVIPRMGPVYDGGRTRQTRQIMSHKYRIFYQIFEEQKSVEILSVWHSSRQEPDLRP